MGPWLKINQGQSIKRISPINKRKEFLIIQPQLKIILETTWKTQGIIKTTFTKEWKIEKLTSKVVQLMTKMNAPHSPAKVDQ